MEKKRICSKVNFAIQADHGGKNQRKRKQKQVFWLCDRTKKVLEHKGDS